MLEVFSKNQVGVIAAMPLSANLFWLRSSIQKHAGPRGAALVGGTGGRSRPSIFFLKLFECHQVFLHDYPLNSMHNNNSGLELNRTMLQFKCKLKLLG